MKKTMKRVAMLLMLVVLLASCSTERRALNQMRVLTHELETRGQYYDKEDWNEAWLKYKEIDEKMDVKELRSDQQQEYGELQARCMKQFAKSKVRNVVDAIKAYLNQSAGILRGFLDLFH